MLNPVFSIKANKKYGSTYILPDVLASHVASANQAYDSGMELRTQECFTTEIWHKLKSHRINPASLNEMDVLDVCAGTGFLSYHLLKRSKPKSLTLMDISKDEINMASKLLGSSGIKYRVGDVTKTNFPDNSFDCVIGNSFLHHFYNVPETLVEIRRILRPGGVFLSLHEPHAIAIPLEKSSLKEYFVCLRSQDDYVNRMRYSGAGDVMKESGSDVWLFKNTELLEIFSKSGFLMSDISNWNLLRPYIVDRMKLHLGKDKKKLGRFEIVAFSISVCIDGLLRKMLPEKCFGSFSISATKPKDEN